MSIYTLVRDGFRRQFYFHQRGDILLSKGILSYLPASTNTLWQPIRSFTRVLFRVFYSVEPR